MTAIVERLGQSWIFTRADLRPVFVRDREGFGPAHLPHRGPALLVAWLTPVRPGGAQHAEVRLPSGHIETVPADQVCSMANLAAVRILPGTRNAPPALRRPA